MTIAAVILAGGSGERLGGVIKATLRIDNRRLIDIVDATLQGAATRLVSCGHHDTSGWDLPSHLIPLPDLPVEVHGPLAGLAAAVDWAGRQPSPPDFIALAPVDSPLLPADTLTRLRDRLAGTAALASFEGQPYPTSSLWRLGAIRSLPADLASGRAPKSLRHLAEALEATEVPFPPGRDGGDPFANINTLADLLALERRTRRA